MKLAFSVEFKYDFDSEVPEEFGDLMELSPEDRKRFEAWCRNRVDHVNRADAKWFCSSATIPETDEIVWEDS